MAESATLDAAASSASVSNVVASASAVISEAAKASESAQKVIDEALGHTGKSTSSKIIGVTLAIVSGLLIGASFVFKKKGLLASQKDAEKAGEGHAYLKSVMWWTGMIIMIVGEICNFVAYAFADAVLVTPLGALSVVVCAILSSIFLKERLSFFGKVGCALCIVGAAIIALNGPEEQSATTIPEFQKLFLAPGFLVFGSIAILASIGIIFFVAPKYGKKNMLVYISVCSLIGGISVSCTQGLGAAIVTSAKGNSQLKEWFFYFLLAFVVVTLLVEINYLNKALELFNTAMVTPTYYVLFTFLTLVTSVILYQGLKAPVLDIITLVMGFLVICAGITLLQMSKIDPSDLKLDRRSTILLSAAKAETTGNEKGAGLEYEDPGIDALRGTAGAIGSIYRARSARRSIASQKSGSEWRRRHTASTQPNTLSTVGMGALPRHQLYDKPMSMPPMPDDSLERISIHSASPVSPRGHMIPSPIRTDTLEVPGRKRAPTIGFSEDVTNHHYPRIGQPGTATHEHEHIHGEDPTTPRAPKARSGSSDSNVWDAYYRESYIDPYATSDRSAGGQVTSPTLTSMLKASLNAPSADLSVQDPRSTRSRSQNRTASSRIGQWGELFSPSKRSMREERDREETEELVRSPGGHARNESKDSKATDESEDDFDRRSVTSADAV